MSSVYSEQRYLLQIALKSRRYPDVQMVKPCLMELFCILSKPSLKRVSVGKQFTIKLSNNTNSLPNS